MHQHHHHQIHMKSIQNSIQLIKKKDLVLDVEDLKCKLQVHLSKLSKIKIKGQDHIIEPQNYKKSHFQWEKE